MVIDYKFRILHSKWFPEDLSDFMGMATYIKKERKLIMNCLLIVAFFPFNVNRCCDFFDEHGGKSSLLNCLLWCGFFHIPCL